MITPPNQNEENPLASFYSFKSSTYNAQLETSQQNLITPPQEEQSVFFVPDLPSSFSAFDLVFWAFTDFLPTLTNFFSSELQFNSLTHTFFVSETEIANYLSHHVQKLSLFPSTQHTQSQSSFFEQFFEPLFFQSESLQHKEKIEFFYFLIHSLFLPAFSRILHLVQAEVLKNTRNEEKKKEVVETENKQLVHEIFNQSNFSYKPEFLYLACEDCLTYTRTFLEKAFPQLLTEEMQLPAPQLTSENKFSLQDSPPHFFKHIDEIKTFFSQRSFLLESQPLASIKPPVIASPNSSLISINAPPQVKSKLAAFFASTQKTPHKHSPPARPFDLNSTIQSIQSSSSFFKRRQFLRFIKQCALQNKDRDFKSYYEETRETLRPFFERQFLDFNVTNIITFILNSFQKYYRNMTRLARGGDESGKYGLSTEFLFGSQNLDFVDPYFLIFHSRQHGTGKSTLARKIFIESFEQSLFLNSIRIPMKHDPSVLKPRDLSATIKLADAGSSLFQFFDDLGPHNIDVTHLKALTSDTDYSYQLKNSNDILTVPFCFNPIFTANLGFDEVKKLIKDPTGDRRLLGVIFPEKTPSLETLSLFEKSGAFTRILTGVNPRWNSKLSPSQTQAKLQKHFFSHYHKIKNSAAYTKVRIEYKKANNFDDVERENAQANLLYPTLALYKLSSTSSVSFRNPPLFFILDDEDLNDRVLKPLKHLIAKDSILFLPTKFLFNEKFLEKTTTKNLRDKAQVLSFNTSLKFVKTQPNFQLLHSPDLSPPLLDHLNSFYASHPSPTSTPVSYLAVTPSILAKLK